MKTNLYSLRKIGTKKQNKSENQPEVKPIRQCLTPCKKEQYCLRANIKGEVFAPELDANGDCPYFWKL
jgi:hypothetical protein